MTCSHIFFVLTVVKHFVTCIEKCSTNKVIIIIIIIIIIICYHCPILFAKSATNICKNKRFSGAEVETTGKIRAFYISYRSVRTVRLINKCVASLVLPTYGRAVFSG